METTDWMRIRSATKHVANELLTASTNAVDASRRKMLWEEADIFNSISDKIFEQYLNHDLQVGTS